MLSFCLLVSQYTSILDSSGKVHESEFPSLPACKTNRYSISFVPQYHIIIFICIIYIYKYIYINIYIYCIYLD